MSWVERKTNKLVFDNMLSVFMLVKSLYSEEEDEGSLATLYDKSRGKD